MKKALYIGGGIFLAISIFIGIRLFSEEAQNKFERAIKATMGFPNGMVEIYVGQKQPVRRWLKVEKLTTREGRDYRYGFGYIDSNNNGKLDPEEKKMGRRYFEVSPFAQYVYLDAPGS